MMRGLKQEKRIEMGFYGFWRYDLYPYCVGGELGKAADGKPGWFQWKNVAGYIVKPFIVMSLKDGRAAQKRIDELKKEKEKEKAKSTIDQTYTKKLLEVMPVPYAQEIMKKKSGV